MRIIQVLTNLLSNAIKFTPKGGFVELLIEENKAEPEDVIIHVIDNGNGIPKEILRDLFNKEVTMSTKGTDGEIGTGFGLPLCQDLIKAHESEIHVESSIETGSRFYFKLSR